MIGLPPLSTGAVQWTVAAPSLAVAVTPVGGSGAVTARATAAAALTMPAPHWLGQLWALESGGNEVALDFRMDSIWSGVSAGCAAATNAAVSET